MEKRLRPLFPALDFFASNFCNIRAGKNVFIRFARDIFTLLGCKNYAKKSGLNLIYAEKRGLSLFFGVKFLLHLDFSIDASREREVLKALDGLWGGV